MRLENDTYVKKAEDVMKHLSRNTDRRGNVKMVTTSQIRNLLAMTADIYNEIRIMHEEKLNDEIRSRLNYLKVRFVYEAGRNSDVKDFVARAEILECLDEIQGLRSRYLLFSRYMEALVAYHKLYGGKD
ncbi:MAG TPA: type III-A CRISPR-associated protein Csm2 [Lachnospiraceae bacterium]|nr:type III-A CRISPR-associated protein Csm2 [Lachnospiraceae bacterium]